MRVRVRVRRDDALDVEGHDRRNVDVEEERQQHRPRLLGGDGGEAAHLGGV